MRSSSVMIFNRSKVDGNAPKWNVSLTINFGPKGGAMVAAKEENKMSALNKSLRVDASADMRKS